MKPDTDPITHAEAWLITSWWSRSSVNLRRCMVVSTALAKAVGTEAHRHSVERCDCVAETARELAKSLARLLDAPLTGIPAVDRSLLAMLGALAAAASVLSVGSSNTRARDISALFDIGNEAAWQLNLTVGDIFQRLNAREDAA